MTARLEVGRIGRAHGLHGEVHITPISTHPDRFVRGATLYVGDRAYVIATSRRHQQHWLIRFEGVDDRTAAEALRNRVVSGDPIGDAPEGEIWVQELIGAEVRDTTGTTFGRVVAVEENPAHDLLVLDNKRLVPIVFVVSHEDDVVVIDPPDGLFDI